jgi:hypothetical protein
MTTIDYDAPRGFTVEFEEDRIEELRPGRASAQSAVMDVDAADTSAAGLVAEVLGAVHRPRNEQMQADTGGGYYHRQGQAQQREYPGNAANRAEDHQPGDDHSADEDQQSGRAGA